MFRPRLLIITLVLGCVALVALAQRFRRRESVVAPETLLSADSALVLIVDGPRAWEQLKPLAQRESWVKSIRDAVHDEWQLDLDKDVMTWAGRAAFSADVTNAYMPLITGVIAIRDYRAAADTIIRLRQGYENHGFKFDETTCEGVTIYSTSFRPPLGPQYALQSGFAFAQSGGCIIVGNLEPAVRSTIEVMKHKSRRPLVTSRDWKRLQPLLPADAGVFIAADLWTLMDKYAALMPMALGEGSGKSKVPSQREVRERIDRFKSLGWLGIAAQMDSPHLRLSLVGSSRKGPLEEFLTRAAASPPLHDSTLNFATPARLGWARFPLNAHMREALNQLRGSAQIASKEHANEKRASPLAELDGDVTLCALSDPAQLTPRWLAIISATDPATLKSSWARAQSDLQKHGYRLTASKREGVVVLTAIDARAATTALRQLFNWTGELPAPLMAFAHELVAAQNDNHLLIATSEVALVAALDVGKKSSGLERRDSFSEERHNMGAGYLDLSALTERIAPNGQVGFFNLKEATDALHGLNGISLNAQAGPSAFRVTLAVNAGIAQVTDAVTKSAMPLSVLANMMGMSFSFAGIAGASSLAPPVSMAGGGVMWGQQTAQAATNIQGGGHYRPRVPASALPPGALPPAYYDQPVNRVLRPADMVGGNVSPATGFTPAPPGPMSGGMTRQPGQTRPLEPGR